jgi:hypothetical protein
MGGPGSGRRKGSIGIRDFPKKGSTSPNIRERIMRIVSKDNAGTLITLIKDRRRKKVN